LTLTTNDNNYIKMEKKQNTALSEQFHNLIQKKKRRNGDEIDTPKTYIHFPCLIQALQ